MAVTRTATPLKAGIVDEVVAGAAVVGGAVVVVRRVIAGAGSVAVGAGEELEQAPSVGSSSRAIPRAIRLVHTTP